MTLEELQTAVYSKLSGLSGLTGVYFEIAPQDEDGASLVPFPYATFSVPSYTPYDDKGQNGGNAIVQIDVWSRDTSTERVELADAVYAALHRQPLSVTGHIDTVMDAAELSIDPDGETRRAMLRARVIAIE